MAIKSNLRHSKKEILHTPHCSVNEELALPSSTYPDIRPPFTALLLALCDIARRLHSTLAREARMASSGYWDDADNDGEEGVCSQRLAERTIKDAIHDYSAYSLHGFEEIDDSDAGDLDA